MTNQRSKRPNSLEIKKKGYYQIFNKAVLYYKNQIQVNPIEMVELIEHIVLDL